jgi:hypothetical protein
MHEVCKLIRETTDSVDLQSPSEKYIECFNQLLTSVDIKTFLIPITVL